MSRKGKCSMLNITVKMKIMNREIILNDMLKNGYNAQNKISILISR